jgi:hypothetical protein
MAISSKKASGCTDFAPEREVVGCGLVCVTTAVAVPAYLGSCCLGSLRRSRPGAPRRCPHFLASLLGAAALRVPARAAAQLCAVAGSPAWQQAACTAGSQPAKAAGRRPRLARCRGRFTTHTCSPRTPRRWPESCATPSPHSQATRRYATAAAHPAGSAPFCCHRRHRH